MILLLIRVCFEDLTNEPTILDVFLECFWLTNEKQF